MMKRFLQGFPVIAATVVATLVLWIASKAWYGDWFTDPSKYVAKVASLTATVLFSWAMILSARLPRFERWFGGLDRVYRAHRMAGAVGFAVVLFHPLFLAWNRLPDTGRFFGYFLPRSGGSSFVWGYNAGVVAMVLLIVLVWLSLWKKVPYHWWKRSHGWMTWFYALAVTHVVLIDADIAAYPLLGAWMYALMAAGLGAGLYAKFLYKRTGPRHAYAVSDIEKFNDRVEVTLEPIPGMPKMRFKPSQFVFTAFEGVDGLSDEPHPFSIACEPNMEGRIKLGIKKLGDYTNRIHLLERGDVATLYGPYGNFSDKFLSARKDCVFIGAGIGITPFLGMWDMALNSDERVSLDECYELASFEPEATAAWKSPQVHLFYVVNDEEDATFDNDITEMAIRSQYQGFAPFQSRGYEYDLHLTSRAGYLTAKHVEERVGSLKDKFIFFCGPPPMRDALFAQFRALGVRNSSMITEDFDFRGDASRTVRRWISSVPTWWRVATARI